MDCEGIQAMDGIESSGNALCTPRRARDVKRKSKKKRKERDVQQKSKKKRKKRPDNGDDVCAICDDGGYVTCCDGGCLRSFHLTKEHDSSSGAEVFKCKDYGCGHFYHPKCVSELLHPDSKVRAALFEQRNAAGLKFLCHVHRCRVCHGTENKDDKNMQFAVCRLCPTTYHRKCLPSDNPFEAKDSPNGYIFQRAWDGILRNRILIYCMKHEILIEHGIPRRKVIIFPNAKKRLIVPKGPKSAAKEQDILVKEELLDHTTSEPPPPDATIQTQYLCSNPMDSFAPKSFFTHPYPGSCGWLDD